MSSREGDDFLVVEALTVEDVAEVGDALGSVW